MESSVENKLGFIQTQWLIYVYILFSDQYIEILCEYNH